MVNKYSSEFQLVTEACSPYLGSEGSCDICDTTTLKEVYKVKSYRFVGGGYGKSNERNIMEELLANGPIVMSFEPG